jgi:hypothetical protein
MISAAIACVLVLGVVGYFTNEWRACNALERDYLNSLSQMRGNIKTMALLTDKSLSDELERMNEAHFSDAERSLIDMYARCGNPAAQTASRKGQDLLLAN